MTHGRIRAALRDGVASLTPGQTMRVSDILDPDVSVAEVLGIELQQVGRGLALAEVAIGSEHLNARGAVQGGVLAAFADAAAGWATDCTAGIDDYTTVQFNTNLVGAVREGDLVRAAARTVHAGRRICACSVELTRLREGQPRPRLVATFQCTQLVLDERPSNPLVRNH